MEKTLDIIRGARSYIANLKDGLSLEQMNAKPEGFNNNLIWNFGHVIATQQILCYNSSGIESVVEESLIKKYATGTKPESFVDSKELKTLEEYFFSTIDRFEEDMRKSLFKEYKAFNIKSYNNLQIGNIEEAIQFVAFHDGLHVGYMMALKRALNTRR